MIRARLNKESIQSAVRIGLILVTALAGELTAAAAPATETFYVRDGERFLKGRLNTCKLDQKNLDLQKIELVGTRLATGFFEAERVGVDAGGRLTYCPRLTLTLNGEPRTPRIVTYSRNQSDLRCGYEDRKRSLICEVDFERRGPSDDD